MEKHWLVKEGNPVLILYALGWGADPRAVAHIRPAGYDALCLYDYRAVEKMAAETFSEYTSVILFAWSFGVPMSERLLAAVPFRKTVALNGTPHPVDDRHGIPERAFRVTLQAVAKTGTETFDRRTYGEFYEKVCEGPGNRPLEAKNKELEKLYELSRAETPGNFYWDEAVIGESDLIFPPQNQLAYWREASPETKIETIPDMLHYPFGNPEIILSRLA